MPGASSEGEGPRSHVSIRAVIETIRAQWDELGEEERAFLVYCLQRLRTQRDGSISQREKDACQWARHYRHRAEPSGCEDILALE
jgi:hypothetical protein